MSLEIVLQSFLTVATAELELKFLFFLTLLVWLITGAHDLQ
jgi:hypothetical protein